MPNHQCLCPDIACPTHNPKIANRARHLKTITKLLRKWDPLQVKLFGEPQGEYANLARPMLHILHVKPDRREVIAFFRVYFHHTNINTKLANPESLANQGIASNCKLKPCVI